MISTEQQSTINNALLILNRSLKKASTDISGSKVAEQFCQLKLGGLDYEVFGVLFLNSRNELIAFDEMFRGTVDHASVFPREVARSALLHNASSVILTHNHPSGKTDPSDQDRLITTRLTEGLGLFDIQVLDHIVVSAISTYSFASHGLL